jgi:hypothetical protein
VTTQNAPAPSPPETTTTAPASARGVSAPPSWPWRLAAAVVGVVALVAGMAGGIGRIGVFFVPAAVVLAVAAVKLWRERP